MRYPDVQPMLATLGTPPTRFTDFAVEAKYDGQRGMAVIEGDSVTLLSRNGADITSLGVADLFALEDVHRRC
jgi:bifunctional non-homologous end joining protein LigD